MVQYHSKHGYVLIGKEDSGWGTAATANKDVGLVQDLNWSPTVDYKKTWTFSSMALQQFASGKYGIRGTLDTVFQHGRLLQYIMGTVSNANSGSDYKHTYSLNSDDSSFTMEDGYNSSSDIVNTLKGCKLDSLTLSLGLDGVLRQRCSFFARDVDPSGTSATAASIDNLPVLTDFHADLKWGTEGSETSLSNVQNFEITFNRVVGGEPTLHGFNSRLAQAHEGNQFDVTYRFTLGFTSATQLQHLLGSTTGILTTANTEITDKGLIFDIKNPTAYGSGQRALYIDLSDAHLVAGTHRHTLGNYIFQDFEGFAVTVDSMYSVDDIVSSGSTFY